MIPIPEAQEIVLKNTNVLASELVPLEEAVGRVLADTVTAKDDLPPFPASIKVRNGKMPASVGCTAAGGSRSSRWLQSGRSSHHMACDAAAQAPPQTAPTCAPCAAPPAVAHSPWQASLGPLKRK